MAGLVCLSSGLTPQYRLDILRLLALPGGATIQFRYGEGILPSGLRENLSRNLLIGSRALLAYVDCASASRRSDDNCPIIPCRYASLLGSSAIGSRFILELRLDEFAPCPDLEQFQKSALDG